MLNRELYLEPSPYAVDGGRRIGRNPRNLTLDELHGLDTPRSPIKAIRAKCVDCSGGSDTEARKCVAVACPLWAFRMGFAPFHARSAASMREGRLERPSSSALVPEVSTHPEPSDDFEDGYLRPSSEMGGQQ